MSTSLDELLEGGSLTRSNFLRAAAGAGLMALPGVLSACGTSSGGGSGSGTLKVTAVADQRPPLQALTAAYAKANSDTKFKTTYAPTDQVQTSVRTQLGAGSPPDAVRMKLMSSSAAAVLPSPMFASARRRISSSLRM